MDKVILEAIAGLAKISATELNLKLTKKKDDSDEREPIPAAEQAKVVKDLIENQFKVTGTNALGRAKREAREEFEKEIVEKYNLQTKKMGLELIAELEANIRKDSPSGDDKWTDETIVKHPKFIEQAKLINSERDKEVEALKTQIEEKDTELKTVKSESDNAEKRKRIAAKWLAKNPVLADADKKADLRKKQINTYLDRFDLSRIKLEGEDDIIPIDEKGERLLNTTTFQEISMDSLIDKHSFVEYHEHDPKHSSHSPETKKGGGGGDKKLPVPKSKEELTAILDDTKNGYNKQQLIQIKENFEKSNP